MPENNNFCCPISASIFESIKRHENMKKYLLYYWWSNNEMHISIHVLSCKNNQLLLAKIRYTFKAYFLSVDDNVKSIVLNQTLSETYLKHVLLLYEASNYISNYNSIGQCTQAILNTTEAIIFVKVHPRISFSKHLR